MTIALTVGAVIGSDPSASLNEFAYRWQTGIAAAIAAFAAFVTVGKMQYVDDRAQKRHEELTAVQLREDRLVLDHAVHRVCWDTAASAELFTGVGNEIADYLDAARRTRREGTALGGYGEEAATSLNNARSAAARLLRQAENVQHLWGSDEARAARRLFGPVLMQTFFEYVNAVGNVRTSFELRGPYSTIENDAYPGFHELSDSEALVQTQRVRDLARSLAKLSEELNSRLLALRNAYPRIIEAD